MEKTGMPNIPGMNAMTDTLEFVKNLWSGMKVPTVGIGGMPGMVMPSLSVEEINKQIADLKAVESWLTVNMNMLRATIQALEVQSATLTTLKAMGDNLNSAMQNVAREKPAAEKTAATAAESESQTEARRKTRSRLKEEFKTTGAADHAENAAPGPAPEAGSGDGKGDGKGNGDFAAPLANPAVWWNLLQDQFKQAVGNAMSAEHVEVPPAASSGRSGKNAANGDPGSGRGNGQSNGQDGGQAAGKRKPRQKSH